MDHSERRLQIELKDDMHTYKQNIIDLMRGKKGIQSKHFMNLGLLESCDIKIEQWSRELMLVT